MPPKKRGNNRTGTGAAEWQKARKAERDAERAAGAQGRPRSATVTPNNGPAKKRARARAPGASPRGSTNSQNIDVFSWGTTSLRSNPQRRLFDGPITVQGSPSSRRLIQRHCGTVARSRVPFGQLCASQKLDTFKEIVEMAG